ncbi:uracil-DNA glycosylase family protein [Flavobacterium chuncheonense]|uniref:Uracil-DNA glycosylase family protein n=1 Tax=Flavobacterium chuncheonense TaxID=2026653 RepID=A0ABW5YLN0_9FLAO
MQSLHHEILQCTHCSEHLPLGPNPVVQISRTAKILIIGQAPGVKVHQTGIPWNDASGKQLRHWLQLSEEIFYDATKIAIVPMGFCYPGKGNSGDLPPRKECAPLWHDKIISEMPDLKLTLLIGQYAQKYYLKTSVKSNLTETVAHFEAYLPDFFVLPHPSPRNRFWMQQHQWFETKVVPVLQSKVKSILY